MTWSVWVGGIEVNDYLLTETEATELEKQYKDAGYLDVAKRKEL
jgi:hypothetical protein